MSASGQQKIWDYFQGEAADLFEPARPRLLYLVKQAERLTRGTKLTILNIGVGDGYLERCCRTRGWNVSALDPSPVAIDKLRRDDIDARVGVIEHMDFKPGTFDVVFCSEILEHLTTEQFNAGLQEVKRVLKDGGLLIGTVPLEEDLRASQTVCPKCGHVFHRVGHYQNFTAARMSALLRQAGFQVLYARPKVFVNLWRGSAMDRMVEFARLIAGQLIPRRMSSNLCFCAANKSQAL